MLIGIIGKPSSGKSTFFKASTLANVLIAPYPFSTLKPNHGIGFVKIDCVDSFFHKQCNPREGYCKNHKRFVPIDLLDVAGLVPEAHTGKGLGLEFLNDLNQADALIHIVDMSGTTDEKGEPTEHHDPLKDIQFLEVELDHWFFNILKKGWENFSKKVKQENQDITKALAKQLSGLRVTENIIKEIIKNLPRDPSSWTHAELFELGSAIRKKTKPMIIAANKVDMPHAYENYLRIKTLTPYTIIPCSAEIELALREASKNNIIDYTPGESHFSLLNQNLDDQHKKALQFISTFLEKNKTTGIQDILNYIVFDVLQYIAIFPGGMNKLEDSKGNVLPDCFLMLQHSTALDFAYKLHTDFGDNFIKAINVKTKMPVGKDYLLQHLDVIEIMYEK